MKRSIPVVVMMVALAAVSSCGKVDYKKTRSGLMYKIYNTGSSKDPLIRLDNVIKLNFVQKLNDSVYQTNYGKMPVFVKVAPPDQATYSPLEIITLMRNGDSAETVQLVDTLLKRGLGMQLPPNAKKGDRVVTSFRIIKVFTADSLAQADYEAELKKDAPRQQKEMEEQRQKQEKERAAKLQEETKYIQDYLANKKINAQRTPKGAFVQILSAGDGAKADSGKFVTVMYKGTTFNGQVFDTNMDTSFHHTEPMSYTAGTAEMIQGFDEGIRQLRKGGHAIVYVPGALGYGPQSRPPYINPYDNLIFEIKLVDVKDAPPPMKQPGQQ